MPSLSRVAGEKVGVVLSSRAMGIEPNPVQGERKGFHARWLLLLLPYAALCFPVVYARATPELFGFPFFYWYQFVWVILTSALLWTYYRLLAHSR